MSKIVKVKNTTGSDKTWVGVTVSAGTYYEIPTSALTKWAVSGKVFTDVGDGTLLVNDGQVDISDAVKAWNHLTGNVPSEVRDTETTQHEEFFGAEVVGGGVESEQAWTYIPAAGEVVTIVEFWVIAPMDRNAYVGLFFDYEGVSEEELRFGKGGEIYKPQDLTVVGDGVKELAIVLINTALSGSVRLAGLLKYNKV